MSHEAREAGSDDVRRTTAGGPDRLVAGTARRALPLADGIALMGYGARTGVARGRRDDLFARALFLEDGGRALLIECDLCLMAVAQARSIRRRVAQRTGLAESEIVVGCTHTHSGPDSGLATVLAGGAPPDHVEPLLDAAVEAGVAAVSGALPARLGSGCARADIGRNRRRAGAAIDDRVHVLRVDRESGAPLAILYLHGCHPTALGHDNLAYSADWPGEASRRVEMALPGALAIFAPAGHADVDPRTRGLLDLAESDQSRGVSYEEMLALGRELGDAVARCAASIVTTPGGPVASAVTRRAIPVHAAGGTPEDRALRLERRRVSALTALDWPATARPRTSELFARERAIARGRPADEVRERLSRVRLYVRDRTAPRIVGGLEPEIEVQVLRLGPMWMLGLPFECCADVALDWSGRLDGVPAPLMSIANGWMRYLPHRRHFDEPGAEQRYEILQSTLLPAASEWLLDAAADLARDLGAPVARPVPPDPPDTSVGTGRGAAPSGSAWPGGGRGQ